MRAAQLLLAPLLAAAAARSPPANCTPGLNISYDISYYAGAVSCGTLFQKADIAKPPTVVFPADAAKTYTLVYVSTCSHCDLSWPDNTVDGDVHVPSRVHYAAANIPASALGTGDVASADQWWTNDWPRHGPGPSQPYAFYLFAHAGPTPAALNSSACWPAVNDYCSHADLQDLVSAEWWTVVGEQWLTGVFVNDTYRAAAGEL